ncbi:DUF262 domain-containing protein [Helicobacter sp. T3_23-1059]
MKANENNFGFMKNENVIEIPFFQRAYVWKEDEWEQLFDDLLDSFKSKKEHFLGSIILKQLPTQAGEGSCRSLIDGQQRLTTFSILIKSLYDKLPDDDKPDYNEYLFGKPIKDKKPKIKHSKINANAFNEVLKATKSVTQNTNDKILDCYKHFSEKIANLDNFREFMDFILESNLWVVINLSQDEDEQKIFDSINSTGVKLTATDIIKNALFDKAIKLQTDYEKLYKEYWESVFEGVNIDFWDSEVATGRLKRAQSEIFLHAFAIVKGFFDAEKSLEKLSASYKDEIKKFDKDKIESFLKELKQYAEIYFNFPKIVFSSDDKKATNFTFDDYELRLFHILKVADVNTIMPLLLKLKSLYGKDKKILKSCYEILEIFVINCYISSSTTKDYNKLFAKMTLELDKTNPALSIKKHLQGRPTIELPRRIQIENALKSTSKKLDNKRAKLVLFWIELFRRRNNPNDIKELPYKYELEHLMPQKWEENWAEIGINKDNAEKLIYQIGNMTLLNGSLNVSISNAKWEIKLNGDGSKKNCISKCADLLVTRDDIVDKKEWNATEIKNRTENLTKEFFKIWDIAKLND